MAVLDISVVGETFKSFSLDIAFKSYFNVSSKYYDADILNSFKP